MTVEIDGTLKILTPAEGKFLTDGTTYAEYQVFMNANKDHSDWYEVDSIPEPPAPDEDIPDTEALNIILGNETK